MSLLLLYSKIIWIGCFEFKSPSLLSHCPPIYSGFDIAVIHERVQTTCLHASRYHHCKYCHYCNVDLCYSRRSHVTNSLLSHIHVNITDLLNIMCSLVATSMILGRLECIMTRRAWICSYANMITSRLRLLACQCHQQKSQ